MGVFDSKYAKVASNCPSYEVQASGGLSSSSSAPDCRKCEHLVGGKCDKGVFDTILSNLSGSSGRLE